MKEKSRIQRGMKSYPGLWSNGIKFDVSINTTLGRIEFKSQTEDRIRDTPAYIPLTEIQKAFVEEKKSFLHQFFRSGLSSYYS